MRAEAKELAELAVRALVGSCAVEDGPTAEQRQLIEALATGYFDLPVDLDAVAPLAPHEAGTVFGGLNEKHRLLETMILLELARHPASSAQTDRVEAYASALDVDNEWQQLARDYVSGNCALLQADYGRFADASVAEAALVGVDDADLRAEMQALRLLPTGTLGRAFIEFYDRYHLPLPGEPGGTVSLAAHDMSHVLAGYDPVPEEEVALQAMLTAACQGRHHFSGLMASLGLFEVGMLPFPGIEPKTGVLARPGAAAVVAEAVRRGAQCSEDFATIDHWAVLDHRVDDLRHDLHIVDRRI